MRAAAMLGGLGLLFLALLGRRASSSSSSSSEPPAPPPPPDPPAPPVGPSRPPVTATPRPDGPVGAPARPVGGRLPQGSQRCRPPADQPPPWPFPGRAAVEALPERDGQESPVERDGEIKAWLRAGRIDPIRWELVTMPDRRLQVRVCSDAVAFGGVRLCASMVTAQAVADALGGLLPTAGIVRARNRAATVRIAPYSMGHSLPGGGWCNPGGAIQPWLWEQDGIAHALERVDPGGAKRAAAGAIVDTTGKDYVLGPYVLKHPDRCAIYGWFRLDGTAIQSPGDGGGGNHELGYFDYSHRITIVHRTALWEGQPVELADIYRDRPQLVSHTGTAERIPTRHPGIPRWSP